jgi:hypothetical protein
MDSKQRLRVVMRILAAWGLLILAALNIVSNAQATQDALNGFLEVNKGLDDVTRWENRLAQLKSDIPENAGVIGYLSGDPQNIEFNLTQYAIIPLVLRHGTNSEWIILNFPNKTIHIILQKYGLVNYAVKPYGYGLYLIHKK